MNKKWKIAFFTLLAANVVTVGSLLFFLLQPSELSITAPKTVKGATFLVHSSKEDVNATINHYIQSKMKKQALPYRVWISDRVYVASQIEVFGRNVPLTVSFLPNVVNGDLELRDPDLSLGELRIPAQYALKYLRTHASLPEGVIIDPDNNRIYVALTNMRLKNGYRLSVKAFDLPHDNIVFTLTVPLK
ncbi:YpmS family protein [Anoxybacillus sp. J5B_2022]|uniref:YpmS family protein n=1 Tax=Anoxybacillus sp. J5B_2022 TaxID=3003246 RepID=UPI002285825B|nr:YpmS family protein [Anoxybacillus sp. J5B_2022]MCZ0755135.1 YpmS family protein [Anoxybacillus sp. J5B_2022]